MKGIISAALTLLFVILLVDNFKPVIAQSGNYYGSGVGNGVNSYASYPNNNHGLRRRSQQQLWDVFDQASKPRRTHYGQSQPQNSYLDPSASSSPFPTSSRWSTGGQSQSQPQQKNLAKDQEGRVKMGVANSDCDDAKTSLTVDWDLSPVNHTCYHPEARFPVDRSLAPSLHCDRLPPRYVPGHVCMDERIHYSENLPTHGDHRPLWPMFGEYIFVPRERWLHNIEHGAVVFLYHPCAHPLEVAKLKKLVKNCVGKHIITPSNLVPPERPLALVAWSCRLLMSYVDENAVVDFIMRRAHRGPEGTYTKEGQYSFGLLQHAKMVGNGATFGYSRVQCV